MATNKREVAKPHKAIDAGAPRETQTTSTVEQPDPPVERENKGLSCCFICPMGLLLWWLIRDSHRKRSS